MQYDMAFIYKFNLSLKTMLNHMSYQLFTCFCQTFVILFQMVPIQCGPEFMKNGQEKRIMSATWDDWNCFWCCIQYFVDCGQTGFLLSVKNFNWKYWKIVIHLCLLDMNYSFSLNYIVKLNERKLSEISIFSSKVFVAEGHKTFIQRNMI